MLGFYHNVDDLDLAYFPSTDDLFLPGHEPELGCTSSSGSSYVGSPINVITSHETSCYLPPCMESTATMHPMLPSQYFESEALCTDDNLLGMDFGQCNKWLYNPSATETGLIESVTMGAVRPYSPEEKKERIERYKIKRNLRNFNKKIKYECRKTLANKRPRIRGRFARNNETTKAPQSLWNCGSIDEFSQLDASSKNGLQ